MGTVPLPRTFVGGEIETAAYLNSLSSVLTFLQNPPRCSVYQVTTANVLTNNVALNLAFDGELYDTDGMHSTTTNNSRITAQTPGLYEVHGVCNFGTNSTGIRQIGLFKNGAAQMYSTGGAIANSEIINLSRDLYLAAGDYIELQATQTSGGNITLALGQAYTFLSARWVAVS